MNISHKKRAFSMIDIIFAVLFIFIMIIVSLKFIFTSEKIDKIAKSNDSASIIVANQIELYNANPIRNNEDEIYFDLLANKVNKSSDDAVFKLIIKSSIIKKNLDYLELKVVDCDSDKEILNYNTKVYIPVEYR